MYTRGMVTGSFDPITRGHEWMTKRACELFDVVYFAIAYNATKPGLFTPQQRKDIANVVLQDSLPKELFDKIRIITVDREFTVSVAKQHSVQFILRGIRNANDFSYESDIQDFNADIEPSIDHIYVIPPGDLARVSSSAIKGFVGVNGWEDKIAKYVHPTVLTALALFAERIK